MDLSTTTVHIPKYIPVHN